MAKLGNHTPAEMNFTAIFSKYVIRNLQHTQIHVAADTEVVANSLRPLIEDVYLQLAHSFVIVLSCRRISTYNFFLNVMQQLFRSVDDMIVQLVFVDYKKPKYIEGMRRYNLLLVDSYEAFLDINVISYTKDYDVNEYYHIFLMQFDNKFATDLQRILNYCWHNNIIHCNVEHQNAHGDLNLYTYFPYTPTKCGNTKAQRINQFVDGKWIYRPSFARKLKNFYGCPLIGMVRENAPFSFRNKRNPKIFMGSEVDMFMIMADMLNFTLILRETEEDDRWWPKTKRGGLNMLIYFANSNINTSELQSVEGNTLIANSLRVIVEEVFMMLAPSFSLVISCRRYRERNLYMSVLQILINMVPDVNIQLVVVDHTKPLHVEGPRYFNLLLVDSFESFLDIDVISYTKNYNVNEFYHIFLMQLDRYVDQDMQNIVNYFWQNQIVNVNIVYQNVREELLMYTYMPFRPHRCENTELVFINQFVDNKWLRKPYFIPKLKNLYGCPLKGGVRDIPFYALVSEENDKMTIKGYDLGVIAEMAMVMNFTIEFKKILNDDRLLPESGGGIHMLENREAHFVFGYYRKRTATSERFSTSVPHYQSSIVTAINYNEHRLKSFEVLMFPFSKRAWIAIVVSCIAVLVMTKLVNWRHPLAIKTFAMVTSTFGIPIRQRRLQYESYFIFAPWVWSTLILRSVYTGLLYHLFSNDVYERMPKNLLAAQTAGYHSVMNEFTFKDVQGVPYYNMSNLEQNTLIIRNTSETVALDYVLSHSKKLIYAVIAQEFLMYYNEVNNTAGQFYTIKQVVLQQQLCFYLTKHSFLIDEFDRVILDLKAVGLIKFLMKRYLNSFYKPNAAVEEDKLIHQKDLLGIYYTCCILYFVAFAVFMVELLSKKLKFLRTIFE